MIGALAAATLLVVAGSLVRPVLPEAVRLAGLAGFSVVVAGNELGLWRAPLPQNARQVPASVIFDGGRVGALRFGFELGTGLRTFLPSALVHLVALAVALFATWPQGLLVGVGFGLSRALMPLLRQASGDLDGWDDAFRRHQRLVRGLGWGVCVVGMAVVVVGG